VSMHEHPIVEQVARQVRWYDSASRRNRLLYFVTEGLKLSAAATAPVLAMSEAPKLITAAVGAFVVLTEGVQQLGVFRERWVSYRTACELVRIEQLLYSTSAGPYGRSGNTDRLLAERLAQIMQAEHGLWQASHRNEQRSDQAAGGSLPSEKR
jgi:hypothetical protein